MDWGNFNTIIWSAIVIYGTFKFYGFMQGLNPYYFHKRDK